MTLQYSLPFFAFSFTLLHPCTDNFALQIDKVMFISKKILLLILRKKLFNFRARSVQQPVFRYHALKKWFLGSNCVHKLLMWSGVV